MAQRTINESLEKAAEKVVSIELTVEESRGGKRVAVKRGRCGRAALQGRVSRMETGRALAPVVVLLEPIDFFRNL